MEYIILFVFSSANDCSTRQECIEVILLGNCQHTIEIVPHEFVAKVDERTAVEAVCNKSKWDDIKQIDVS